MIANGKLFKQLLKDKNARMYRLLGIELVVLLLGLGWLWLSAARHPNATNLMAFAGMVWVFSTMVLVGLLAKIHEHLLVANRYRLIPTTDTRLYCLNLLTSFIAMLYFTVIQFVLFAISTLITLGSFSKFFAGFITSFQGHNALASEDFKYFLLSVALFAIIIFYVWVFISTVHFVGRTLSVFLPERSQKYGRGVLYIAVVWLSMKVLQLLINVLTPVVQGLASPGRVGLDTGFAAMIAVLVFLIIVLSALNIYLMKHWVETNQAAV